MTRRMVGLIQLIGARLAIVSMLLALAFIGLMLLVPGFPPRL
jgi:hypothetical protein